MPIEHCHSHLRRVDAAAEVVWEVVSDHGGMVRWLPFKMSLLEVHGQGHPHGVGAIRSLTSVRGTIVERITAFDGVQHRLGYELIEGLPLRRYAAQVSVTPLGTGCILNTEMTVRSRIPGIAALFGLLMTRLTTIGAARFAELHFDPDRCGTAEPTQPPRFSRWRHRLTQPAAGVLYLLGGVFIGLLLQAERFRTAVGPQARPPALELHHETTAALAEFEPSAAA